jgi:hypothetical protein
MLFKNAVRTSKRTPHFTITTINWLTLFKFKELQAYSAPRGLGEGGHASGTVWIDGWIWNRALFEWQSVRAHLSQTS